MDPEAFLGEHLAVIREIAESICRRNGVNDDDAEDFASEVRLKMYENDFATIRKFQGKASFTTYLYVVISKFFLDYRRRTWGKWTASTQAKRLGPVAILLEKLVYRDSCSFDAACRVLEQKPGFAIDRRQLQTMLSQLPRRAARRFAGDQELAEVTAGSSADDETLIGERDDRLAVAESALQTALGDLPVEDRVIVRMLYYEGISIADIARGLGLDQKRLYPRTKQILAALKKRLVDQGVSSDFLADLHPD